MRNQSTIKQRATHLKEVGDDAAPLISTVQEDQIANRRRQPKGVEGIREREGGEQQDLLDHAVHLLETSRALLLRLDFGIDLVTSVHGGWLRMMDSRSLVSPLIIFGRS